MEEAKRDAIPKKKWSDAKEQFHAATVMKMPWEYTGRDVANLVVDARVNRLKNKGVPIIIKIYKPLVCKHLSIKGINR